MTPSERFEIEWECARLIQHYANLTDAHDWPAIIELYTEDGLMTRPTAPDSPIRGRDALLKAFHARPSRVSQHVCGNIVVDVESATEASAYSVILLYVGQGREGDGLPVRDENSPLIGTYCDRFRLTSSGWRFSERRGSLTFRP